MENQTIKQNFNVYPPESKVFAISYSRTNHDHVAIYEAIVKSVKISWNETLNEFNVNYELKAPSGKSWDNLINEKFVCEEFKPLVNVMTDIWAENNRYGGYTNKNFGTEILEGEWEEELLESEWEEEELIPIESPYESNDYFDLKR